MHHDTALEGGDTSYRHNSSATTLEKNAGLLVSTKVDALLDSCNRIPLEGRETVSWAVLLDSFCASTTSLGLLREATPTSFTALAIVPHEVPPDVPSITSIPDTLSAFPGDAAYEEVKQLKQSLQSASLINEKRILTTQDSKQLRLDIQKFNHQIDEARALLNKTVLEAAAELSQASKIKSTLQPLKPKPAQLRKDYETLHNILLRLYRGTSLMPARLEY